MNSRQVQFARMIVWSAAAVSLLFILLTAGCAGIDKLRGNGLSESENWGQELRKQQSSGVTYGGLTAKANQIERNLGVR